MKNYFGILLLIVSFSSCQKNQKEKVSNNVVKVEKVKEKLKLPFIKSTSEDYGDIKRRINKDKQFFKKEYGVNKTKTIDSASIYLYNQLINKIVPHWYETPWDFNGHTNSPKEGEIACGYFVSTTLKHLGFNLNRYKMAQQAGLNEAIALQPKNKLKIYSKINFKDLKSKLNKVYKDGIYFVGLDNHVGYVVIKDKEIYFLHSSYCDNKVVIELAKTSSCFISNIYVFAEITSNPELIKKWILNESLIIPTQ